MYEELLHVIFEYNVLASVTYVVFQKVNCDVNSESVYQFSVVPDGFAGLYDVVIGSHRLTFFVSIVSPLREKVKALVEEFLKQRTENP